MTLISMFRSEINSLDISPIEVSWELSLWNIFSWIIFLLELLGFVQCRREILLLSKGRSCGLFVNLRGCLSKWERCLFFAMWPIINMMLLKFTSIGFPSKIKVINSLNHKIVLVRRYVSMMSVKSLVRFSLEFVISRSNFWINHKVGFVSWSVSSGWCFGFSSCISLDILSARFNGIHILIFSCLRCVNFSSLNLSNLSLSNFNFRAWQVWFSF